ncbi:MAG: response regulator [Acidobacteriota bacterium]|nr:response regulator [Acidobacteriota bacterium]
MSRQEADLYRAMFEKNPAVQLLIDPLDGRIVDANAAACAFYGWDRQQLLSLSVTDLDIAPAGETPHWVQQAQDARKPPLVLHHRLASGEVRDMESHMGPVSVRGRRLLHVILHDITPRIRVEKLNEELLSLVTTLGSATRLDPALEAILATTLAQEGVEAAGIHLPATPAAPAGLAAHRGFPPELLQALENGVEGGPLVEVLASESLVFHAVETLLARGNRGGRPPFEGLSGIALRSGGETIAVLVVGTTLGPAFGAPGRRAIESIAAHAADPLARLLASLRQRRADVRRQDSRRLESLGRLAGGMAHDFNNLLMGVLGYAAMIRSEIPPEHPAGTHARRIEQAARRAASLTRQLLAYEGRGQLELRLCDPRELLEGMRELLAVCVPGNAALTIESSPPLPPIEGDPSQLRQVLMNLVTNAAEALPRDGGTIHLRASRVALGDKPLAGAFGGESPEPGEYVLLEVRDDGCGIAPAALPRIFDPFYSTKPGGRGLGLAAVAGSVLGHRGYLTVDSTPGEGTTVGVYLPVEIRPRTTAPPSPPPGAGQSRRRILVADDEELVRDFVSEVLRQAGYSVEVVDGGRAALAAFSKAPAGFDAVLLDMTMPDMSGGRVFEELRRIDPDVRVLLSSGYTADNIAAKVEGSSAAGFLQKPYSDTDLLRKLEQVLDS